MGLVIRRARPGEAPLLTALALRSKAHWGYDEAFMALARQELSITLELLTHAASFLAERDGDLVGFYVLVVEEARPLLRDLWVEPRAIGTGVGAALFAHMLREARRLDYRVIRIESDPNAEGFYLKMGAVRTGEIPSKAIVGRVLPVLEITSA